MMKEITKREFEAQFKEVDMYAAETAVDGVIYLDNGVYLLGSEWNGERYQETLSGDFYYPIYEMHEDDDPEIIGYEVR